MQTRTKQGMQTLRQAHAFLASRAYSAAIGELKPQVDALAAIVGRLEVLSVEQGASDSGCRAATETKRSLASQLRLEYLRPIARIAVKLFIDDPELRKSFLSKPPRDDEGLMQAAGTYLERATPFKDRFAEKGLAPDFLERLKKAIDTFREVRVQRGLEQARRASASIALVEEMARGREQVRLVDAMLAPRLASRPEHLAEWRSIARFAPARGAAETVTEGETTGSTPTTPSTPTIPTTPTTPTTPASAVQPASGTSALPSPDAESSRGA